MRLSQVLKTALLLDELRDLTFGGMAQHPSGATFLTVTL